MEEINSQLMSFLDSSPTSYHAVENMSRELLSAGYERLCESEVWKLREGGKYFVTRGDSALIAFRTPLKAFTGFMVSASHCDSPNWKLRENSELPSAGNCLRLTVEPYGGLIHRSWLDRPLSIAGRMIVKRGDRMETVLVNIDRDLVIIPSVAIHLNRDVNSGTALDPAVDIPPLFAMGQEPGVLRRLISETTGEKEDDILSTELFLYPRTPSALLGANREFLASSRLDDLHSTFGCFKGFMAAKDGGSIPVFCVFNNEEIGSNTRQGADSTFLTDVLSRISGAFGRTPEEHLAAVANSFMVSADNSHAIHPAHPEYSDKLEQPLLNGGVVIKYNSRQRYTTDATASAVFRSVCLEAGVPVQSYSNRADLPGGATLGNISSSHFSVPTVDIGLPQLAMHSCYEVGGAQDTEALVKAMTVYFSKSFRLLPGGGISL